MITVKLKTGAWYKEREYEISFPENWDVKTYWPNLPKCLTEEEIKTKINNPVKSKPIRELLKGKSRPLIIIDDITRPTPVFRVLKIVIDEFLEAGISANVIEILIATGTHGPSNKRALINKVGPEVYNAYKVINHYDKKRTTYVGQTSFGTPVYINPRVLKSDFFIGIGGIYPQYTTGFGGGSKLILGVLGRKTISSLHFNHEGVRGNFNTDNNFRNDVSEIARLVGFDNLITVHTNEKQEVINIFSGDHFEYFPEAAAFSYNAYLAPTPDNADVIIANAFPSDVSYTFMRKGNFPLLRGTKEAVKIIVGSNPEGLGHHGLFPQGKGEKYMRVKRTYDKLSIMKWSTIISKIVKKISSKFLSKNESALNIHQNNLSSDQEEENPLENLIVYVPPGGNSNIKVHQVEFINNWQEILDRIQKIFNDKGTIKVRIYPCSPLQSFKKD